MTKTEFLKRFHQVHTRPRVPDYPLKEPGKPAAVLCPIVEREGTLNLLFTQRSSHLKHHAGQVSFPGGKQEPTDGDLMQTALRETEEEIGLSRVLIDVVGSLPRFRTVSRFDVTPYVGFVSSPFELTLDKNEVESVFEVPLAHAINPENHHAHWVERKGERHPVYFIPWGEHNIWGATAAFVRNLSNKLALPQSGADAHY